jgi:hypothetical protein
MACINQYPPPKSHSPPEFFLLIEAVNFFVRVPSLVEVIIKI